MKSISVNILDSKSLGIESVATHRVTVNELKVESFRTDKYGTEYWFNSKGERHRDYGLPAVVYANGSKFWYINGKIHRDNGLPAIEFSNGTKEWWVNDKRHRDNGLPAIEFSNGTKEWWVNGKFIKIKDDEHKTLLKVFSG